MYICGCATTKVGNVGKNELYENTGYEILRATMKNGEKISLKNKSPRFQSIYKGIPNVLLYYTNDSANVNMNNTKQHPLTEHVIKFTDIKSVKIKKETMTLGTGGAIAITAGLFLLILFIIQAQDFRTL